MSRKSRKRVTVRAEARRQARLSGRAAKQERIKQSVHDLIEATRADGFEVVVLNESPCHVRVIGNCTVDFWPASSKAWVFGSAGKASPMTVTQVADLARRPRDDWGGEAQKHMSSFALFS